jgi:rhomboid protease GluP
LGSRWHLRTPIGSSLCSPSPSFTLSPIRCIAALVASLRKYLISLFFTLFHPNQESPSRRLRGDEIFRRRISVSQLTCAGMEAGSQAGEAGANFAYARIAAQSRRQAMDWSLVLASQDIHPIIQGPEENGAIFGAAEEARREPRPTMERPRIDTVPQSAERRPEGGTPNGPPVPWEVRGTEAATKPGWSLLVERGEYERAMAAIRQYRLENRGWAWRRELPGGVVDIHTGALFWCLLLIAWHWVMTFVAPGWDTLGEMSSARVHEGEWYRLFTAVLLHSDLAHLMANATFGAIFLGLAMARFGWGVTLLATFLAGAAGNVLGLLMYHGPYRGRGASGMMMGALGLLCVQSFGLWRRSPKAARYILSGVLAGFLLFVLFGLDPGSDVLAHFGGFVAGLAFGALLAFVPENKLQKNSVNATALAVVSVIIAVTWGLALR